MTKKLNYLSGYQDGFYRLHIELGTNTFSSAFSRPIVIDTGSTGIVVPEKAIQGYEDIEHQFPPPGYTSSGNHSYEGKWVKAPVKLYDDAGNQVTTEPVLIFAVTNAPHVSMMGVGFNSHDYPTELFNPFINIKNQDKNTRQGYIIQQSSVVLGLTDDNVQGFSMIGMSSLQGMENNFVLPNANLELNYGSAQESPYTNQLPLLVDTGIDYMIITNGDSAPTGYEDNTATPKRFNEGVNVNVTITKATSVSYEFDTKQDAGFNDNSSAAPSYVRWGFSKTGTILNTGRHFTYIWDYLFDPDNKQLGFKD